MRLQLALAVAGLGLCLSGQRALACDGYQDLPMSQAQQLLTQLKNPGADTMTRVFAFNALACSSMPAVRQVAMKEALKAKDDPIILGQVLEEIMMQRDGIVVDLIPNSNLSLISKKWIESTNNSISYRFYYKDAKAGCISMGNYGDRCVTHDMVKLSGTKVTIYDGPAIGEFELQPDNTMRGYIKASSRHQPVQAKFSLF